MIEETRIYVVVPGTIQVPVTPDSNRLRTVIQPAGRQIAQACHVVSKLRFIDSENKIEPNEFQPTTTIILRARDSKEMLHVGLLLVKKKLHLVTFSDINKEAYGPGVMPTTAIAVFATKKQVSGILDYLPLWEGREGV